jgi:hypothetical protein
MSLPIALLAGLAVGLGPAAKPAAPPAVEIKDAVAQVTVIPEDRSDILVEFLTQDRRLPLKVKAGRTHTVVDGGIGPSRIRSCSGVGEGAVVRVAGVGDVAYRELPRLVIHTPRDVDVSAGGAVFGAIGRSRSASLGAAGCGDWVIGNVEQKLRVNLAGSGGARTGSAGEAKLRVAGSGGISTADVRGRLDVDVAGAGDVRVKSVAGALDVHVAGSGDVTVDGGRASPMTASVAGSGDIVFKGVADTLDARIVGSGDVRAREVRGRIKKSVMGSGAVRIG